MELLQSGKYKFNDININLIDELKMVIIAIVEVCSKGVVSYVEAENAVANDIARTLVMQCKLEEKLSDLDNGISEDNRRVRREMINRCLEDLEDYRQFLMEVSVELSFVPEGTYRGYDFSRSSDYMKNRVEEIEAMIKKDGLAFLVRKETPPEDNSASNIPSLS